MDIKEPWYVYIVECSDNTLYTGISNNVSKRVLKHNSGKGAKYTRSRLPVALKWFKECKDRSEAAKEEYRIKKLNKKQKIELMKDSDNKDDIMDLKPFNLFNHYKVNVNNVENMEDIKLILKAMDLHYSPKNKEDFKKMKHLLIVN